MQFDHQDVGFYVQEQNAAGVGRGQAGNAAITDDASTAYYNPAGLTQLEGFNVNQGLDLILGDVKLTDTGSRTRSTGAFLGSAASGGFGAVRGSDGGNPSSPTVVPNFSLSYQLADTGLTFGFAASSPFGSANKYSQDFFGRYDSIDTFLFTFDLSPSVAFKVNDWLSVGAALNEQYAYVKLRNALPNPLLVGGAHPGQRRALDAVGPHLVDRLQSRCFDHADVRYEDWPDLPLWHHAQHRRAGPGLRIDRRIGSQ